MQCLDVGSLIERVPLELDSVRLLCTDQVCVKDRPMWRARFMPTRTVEGDTSLWGFTVDMCWEPVMEPPALQFSTQAPIHLPASARRWLEGKVRVYNDQGLARLTVLVHDDESISVYSRQILELAHGEVEQLSQERQSAEATMVFYFRCRERVDLLFQAWMNGRKFGCEYRTLN